jgi:hypothetical protein
VNPVFTKMSSEKSREKSPLLRQWAFSLLCTAGIAMWYYLPIDPVWEECFKSLAIVGCLAWLKVSSGV